MKLGFSIQASGSGINAVRLRESKGIRSKKARNERGDLAARRWRHLAERELSAYITGRLRSFSTPCDLSGLPPFTRAVLSVTARIPYGEVRSYRWIAERLGNPGASRAVGNALARNPVAVIIPCHRVIRSDGGLGGYAWGLRWKKKFLRLEAVPRSLPRRKPKR